MTTISAERRGRRGLQMRPLSIPNLLTYGRIAAVPLVGATFFVAGPASAWIAFTLFVAASVTDWFDGYLARAWEQQSSLGKMLDPIADKLLVSVSILILVANGMLAGWSIWAAIIILMREVFVSGLREFLAELQVSVPVTRLAKWKTTAQMVALAVLLLAPAIDRMMGAFTTIGLGLFWGAAIITLYTGFDYLRSALRHLMENEA